MHVGIHLLLALICVGLVPSRGRAGEAATPLLPISDLRPGMRGVARTVFEGTEPRSFDVELMGVADASRPKGRLILFRALGDTLAHMGIVAGMSGSPVYVDGKLVGAISMGFAFAKDAIGLITPIDEMLDAMDRVGQPAGSWMGSTTATYAPILKSFLTRTPDPAAWESPLIGHSSMVEGSKLTMLCGSGWAPGMEPTLANFAAQSGLAAPSGAWGGDGGDGEAPGDLLPGSAMGVLLIGGDASLGAIGTVTYRDGNRVVAFGHPLFQAGPVELPLTAARIHTVVASVSSSFKLGSPGTIVGTIRQDLRAGVCGVVGEKPAMLPITIDLRSAGGRDIYHYRVARGVLLEPSLATWAATNSFLQHGWKVGEAWMEATVTVAYNHGRMLSRRERLAARSPSTDIAEQLLAPLPLLLTNPFEKVVIDSVRLDVSYAPELRECVLVDLWAERESVRPGERLLLTARLQDRQGARREIPIEIPIPERWQGETLLILAGSVGDLTDWDRDRSPAIYEPKDLAGLERLVREFPDDGNLLVRIYAEEDGVVLGDHEVGALPDTYARVLGAGHKRGPARSAPNYRLEERRIDAGGAVSGGMAVRVHVE
jgi:hypothetical protein